MSKKNRKFRENKNTRKRESWIKDNKKSVITEDFYMRVLWREIQ